MIVGYDREAFLLQQYGGVSKYFAALIKNFEQYPSLEVEPFFTFNRCDNEYVNSIREFKNARWQIRVRGGVSTGLTLGPIRSITQTWSGGFGHRKKLDLLHATFYRPTFWERSQSKKLAVTIHDFIPEYLGWTGVRNPHIGKKRLVKKAKLIICVSQHTANDLANFYGVADDRVVVIHHGVDHFINDENLVKSEKFNRPTVLYVGHRLGYKNFKILPKALKLIKGELPDIQLIIAGPELSSQERELLRVELGDKDWRHVGYVSDKELNDLYMKSHVHCVTSQFEGFGMTTLESLAMGTPVVANDIPVFKEVLGTTGNFFDGSVEGLVQAIQQVLQSRDYKKMSLEGLVHAKSFSWQKSAEAHAAAYKRALA